MYMYIYIRIYMFFESCIIISLLSILDFGRRLVGDILSESCIAISLPSLLGLSLLPFHSNLFEMYHNLAFLSLDIWSLPIRCNRCELYHTQLAQSLGLWSAAVLPDTFVGLYRNQSAQPLGVWSAAGW